MYCKNCGRELNEEWKVCPNCGKSVNSSAVEKKQTDTNINEGNHIDDSDKKTVFEVNKMKKAGRLLLKVLALIAIVCFFCPLYMVSCSGQELLSLNGVDMTFGFEYLGEEIEGNWLYGILAILPLYGFAVAFANEQKLREKGKAVELKYRSYASAISFGTLILLIRYITSELVSNAAETELEIVPCTALRIMTVVAVISVLVGGYLACLYELHPENAKKVSIGITIAKCCGKILAGSFVLLLVICIPFTLAKGELRPSTDPDSLIFY